MRFQLILFLITSVTAEIIENFKFELIEVINKEKCTKDPLTCWLENLKFKIPDTCFMVENTECCITNFICDGIQLGGINSAYNSPASFFFELEDLGTKCSGQWKYGRLGGSLSATISNTDISTTAVVGKNGIYPNSLVFPSCAVPNIDIDLKFSGGLVGFILQLISSIVESGLEKAIYTLFCEKAEPTISMKITEALTTKIDPVLETLVSYGPNIPPSFPENTYIDWSNSLPGLLEKIEDKFANDYLNKVIDTLTGGTGIIKVDLHNTTIEWPVVDPTSGPLGTIKLILHNFEVSGLDTFYDISLLTPSDPSFVSYSPYSIWSTFSIHSLGLSLGATIDVSLDQGSLQGGELKETFTLKLEVSDTKVGADVLIPVNIERFDNLYLNQIFDISCLISTADALSISSLVFNTHIDSMKVIQTGAEGSLEEDIDELINNLVELGVKDFPELLSGVISGISQGPLKSIINEKLSDILLSSSSKCVPHVNTDDESEPNYVIWSESAGLEELDYLLNTVFGVSGINTLIESLTDGSGSVIIPVSRSDILITLFGLNTFYKFSLITPSLDVNKPYNLDSDLALGYCEGHSRNQKCTPVGISLSINSLSEVFYLNEDMKASSSLSTNLYNFDISSSLLAKFDKNKLYDIQVSDLFVYTGNHSGCFLSSFDNLAVDSLSMTISEAKLSKGALVNKDITKEVEKLLGVITGEEAVGAINKVLSQLLEDAEVACESGSWPIHDDDDNNGNNDDDPTKDCEGPIQCGLNKVIIGPFPDICVDIKEGVIGLCIKELSCYNLDIVGIESENVNSQTLRVGVDKFAITCGADISVSVNPSSSSKTITYDGSFSISMTNFSGLVDMVFGSSTPTSIYPPLPNSLRFTNCHTSETHFKVKFEGGVIGSILNKVLGPPISEALESAVYWALCDVLNPVLGHVISKVLKDKVDPAIQSIIDKSIPPSPVIMPGYLEWNNTLVGKIHNIIDFMKANEGKVLRCMIGDKSPLDGYNINSLINMMTDNTGEFDIYLNIPVVIGDVTLTFEILTISGLNTIGDLFLLNPISGSGVTLSSSIELSSLDFQLTVMLRENSGKYEQEAIIDLKLNNVILGFDIVAAMKLSLLNNLYSDQILHLPCLMSTLDEFYLSSLLLEMNIENLSINQISGGDATPLEEEVSILINDLFDLLLDGYPLMVTDIIEGIFQGPIKEKINTKLEEVISSYKDSHVCNEHGNYTTVNWIEWINSNLIEKVDVILNDILGSDGLNQFIDCVTNGTGSTSIVFPNSAPIFAGWKITLGGLDSFSDFALIYPINNEPYDLGNSLGLGSCPSSTNCHPFLLEFEGMEENGQYSHVMFEFDDLKFFLDLLVKLDLSFVKNLQYQDFHREGCFLASINLLSFQTLSLNARSVKFYFSDGNSEVDLSGLVERIFSLLSNPSTLSNIDSFIQSKLEIANNICINGYDPSNIDDDGDSPVKSSFNSISWKYKITGLLIFCVFGVFYLHQLLRSFSIIKYDPSKEKELIDKSNQQNLSSTVFFSNQWFTSHVKTIFQIPNKSTPNIENSDSENQENESMADIFIYDALIASDALSPFIRISVPITIIILVFILIISLLNPAAYVMMEIKAGDKILGNAAIFDFGYGGTVHDLWVAEAYFLSIIIALFTGVWPFIKLVLMFFAWILPTSIFLLENRDRVLRWVDILGKWSLVDSFVMVLMMVAFHVKFSIVPGVTVGLTVSPHWQFYTFLGATMGSLVVGHIAVGCHRAVSELPILVNVTKEQPKESMMNHKYTVKLPKSYDSPIHEPWITKKLSFTTFGKVFILLLLSIGLFVVVNGTLLNSVTFELKGLTGYLMKDPISSYSLIDIGVNVPAASGVPNNLGVRFIQLSYFLFSISIPILFILMLIILWIIPFQLSTFKSVIIGVEMLNAWSALDVFVLSIIASVLEIKQYAKFLVGDHCDAINKILKQEMDSQLEGDDTCFDVVARMTTDSTVVCFAAIFLILMGLPFISLCHRIVAERLNEENQRDSVNEWVNRNSCYEKSLLPSEKYNNFVDKNKNQDLTNLIDDNEHKKEKSWKMRFISSCIFWGVYIGLVEVQMQETP